MHFSEAFLWTCIFLDFSWKPAFLWKPDFHENYIFVKTWLSTYWSLFVEPAFFWFFMKTCILVEPEPAFLRKPDFHENLHFSGNEPTFFWKLGVITFSRKLDFQTKIPKFQPRPGPKFARSHSKLVSLSFQCKLQVKTHQIFARARKNPRFRKMQGRPNFESISLPI